MVGASQLLHARLRVEHKVFCTKENVACRIDSIYNNRNGGIIAKYFEVIIEDLKDDITLESRWHFNMFSVDSSFRERLTANHERKHASIGIFTDHIQ